MLNSASLRPTSASICTTNRMSGSVLSNKCIISGVISAHFFRVTCNMVSCMPIQKTLNCKVTRTGYKHILLSHLCPPGGFLPNRVLPYLENLTSNPINVRNSIIIVNANILMAEKFYTPRICTPKVTPSKNVLTRVICGEVYFLGNVNLFLLNLSS